MRRPLHRVQVGEWIVDDAVPAKVSEVTGRDGETSGPRGREDEEIAGTDRHATATRVALEPSREERRVALEPRSLVKRAATSSSCSVAPSTYSSS